MDYITKSPVAVVIFNREEKARELFNILRKVKPNRIFVIADGPRNQGEVEKCKRTRAVFDKIDWSCEVQRNYSSVNLGCCVRPASGFDWVFENTDRAILLEDDCLPSLDFFRFCDEMLERYENDTRIMQVCGTNLMGCWDAGEDSYFFSQWASCWGWATWSRAWRLYDMKMEHWKSSRVKQLVRERLGSRVYKIRANVFDEHCCGGENITAWDHQWSFARLINSGLSITPSSNLVTNTGSGENATHTQDMTGISIETHPLLFPLRHPKCVMPDCSFDIKMAEKVYNAKPIYKKILPRLKRMIGKH